MKRHADAGIKPDEIDYINAHGAVWVGNLVGGRLSMKKAKLSRCCKVRCAAMRSALA